MIDPCNSGYGSAEHRCFDRVELRLSGRCMFLTREEFPCRTVNISPGGALLSVQAKPLLGESVIVYLDALGRLPGKAIRVVSDGFGMTLNVSQYKRQKLADHLTWFKRRNPFEGEEKRRHERFVPLMQRTVMRVPCGKDHIVKVVDLSVSGVAVETKFRPELGAPVEIGGTSVTVVRHFADGFAGEFIVPFKDGEIDELTRL